MGLITTAVVRTAENRASCGNLKLSPTVSRVFAEKWIGLSFLESVSCVKSIPTPEKKSAVGRSGPNATFNLL